MNNFKVGDECWFIDTFEINEKEITIMADRTILRECDFDEDCWITTHDIWWRFDRELFKSKSEAINAMIKRLEKLNDEHLP